MIDFGSIVFDSNDYGKYGYTEYYNFFQFTQRKEKNKYQEITFIFELYSICKMLNDI